MQIRVSVYAMDLELRAWLVDELELMTWIGTLQLDTVPALEAIAPDRDLVIVGLDRLPPDQLAVLRARVWGAPTIAIGSPPADLAFDRVLPVNVTSRELKQAIRELRVTERSGSARRADSGHL